MPRIDVSVIIVNYNTRELLKACLRSVVEKTSEITYEVIVVDNASNDGSAQMVRREFPGVRLIASAENLGFGKGNNLGMKEASGAYYLLLNPDTVLVNDAIRILFDFMEGRGRRDNIAVCGANLVDGQERPGVSFGRFPKPHRMILYSLPFAAVFRRNEGIVRNHRSDYALVDYVIGASFFCRRDVIDMTGMFDEHYFAYYEETDLSKRIALQGFKSAVVPSARIRHLEGQSFKSRSSRKERMVESSLYYLEKFHRDSVFFGPYCLIHELKYSLYRLLGPKKNKPIYDRLITRTRSLRRRREAAES